VQNISRKTEFVKSIRQKKVEKSAFRHYITA
jgi:thiaminase